MWVSSSLTFLEASVGCYDLQFKNSLDDLDAHMFGIKKQTNKLYHS